MSFKLKIVKAQKNNGPLGNVDWKEQSKAKVFLLGKVFPIETINLGSNML